MFKNNFFKKVTSCCLTLASVLSLSLPCNAKLIEGSDNVDYKLDYLNKAFTFMEENVLVRQCSDIQFYGFNSYEIINTRQFYGPNRDFNIYYGTFYMSSNVLEREFNKFKRLNNQSYQKFGSREIDEFIKYLNNRIEINSESCDNCSCSYLFIINGKIRNEDLLNLIKNENSECVDFIYETEINNTKKENLFKKLGFKDNFQNNGCGYYNSNINFEDNSQCDGCILDYNSNSKLKLGVGVLEFLPLVALGAGTLFIAKKNASDSKVSKKTNSISKKVIELAKSVIN